MQPPLQGLNIVHTKQTEDISMYLRCYTVLGTQAESTAIKLGFQADFSDIRK